MRIFVNAMPEGSQFPDGMKGLIAQLARRLLRAGQQQQRQQQQQQQTRVQDEVQYQSGPTMQAPQVAQAARLVLRGPRVPLRWSAASADSGHSFGVFTESAKPSLYPAGAALRYRSSHFPAE